MAAALIPEGFARLAPEPTKVSPATAISALSDSLQYKIEIKLRNHNVIDRQEAIDEVLKYVPTQHKIDLEQPETVILLEIFKVGFSRITYRALLIPGRTPVD